MKKNPSGLLGHVRGPEWKYRKAILELLEAMDSPNNIDRRPISPSR